MEDRAQNNKEEFNVTEDAVIEEPVFEEPVIEQPIVEEPVGGEAISGKSKYARNVKYTICPYCKVSKQCEPYPSSDDKVVCQFCKGLFKIQATEEIKE